MRMVARSTLMHKHTVGPLPAGLGNRDCHTAQRLLITARLPADLGGSWRLLESTVALQIGPFWAQRPAAYGVRFSFPGSAHSP